MVRYDKCVEALYDRGLIEDKNKSLQMLKVMKGAISMSKSKTGECIFRTNKLEKKNLERVVRIDKRNSMYNISRVDTGKKHIVGRYMKMLDRQTTCSSQILLEEALDIREPNSKTPTTDASSVSEASPRRTDDDGKLKKYLDLRLARDETAPFLKRKRTETGTTESSQNEAHDDIGEDGFVTERKEIRDKYSTEKDKNMEPKLHDRNIQGTILSKSVPALTLPSVSNAGFKRPQAAPQKAPTDDQGPPMFERDLTNWRDWRLKDKTWITSYIRKEKTRHEDLILRNALVKIETEMSGANSIRRQQIRQKLQVEREDDMKQRDREHTADKLPPPDKNNRTKSLTFDKTPKIEFKKSRTEVGDTTVMTISTPEQKISREKSVTFAENVSFKTKDNAVNKPKVCREKTVCIVYQDPNEKPCMLSPTGSLNKTPSLRSIFRRRESTLSARLSESKLPMITEGPSVVSPVSST